MNSVLNKDFSAERMTHFIMTILQKELTELAKNLSCGLLDFLSIKVGHWQPPLALLLGCLAPAFLGFVHRVRCPN